MYIENIFQITTEDGVSSLSYLADNNNWYIIRNICSQINFDPHTKSLSLDMAKIIRQTCKFYSNYPLPWHVDVILPDPAILAPIKASLGSYQILNLDSYNWIRRDMALIRTINYGGPFLTTWTLSNGEIVDFRLEYLRKNILLDSIKWHRKISQVIDSVCFANADVIEHSLNCYYNGAVQFVDFIIKHGEISEAVLQNKIDNLNIIRSNLINDITNNVNFSTVKNSNDYPELLADTSDYFSYRKDRPPIFSNQNQFNCALVDVSIHTLDNTSASAICKIFPKK